MTFVHDRRSKVVDSALIVALLAALLAVARAYFVTPVQIDDLQRTDAQLQTEVRAMRTDHDLLQRIDERTERMAKDIAAMKEH